MRWVDGVLAPEVSLGSTSFPDLADAEVHGAIEEVIAGAREVFQWDSRVAMTDPWFSGWLGRRYRHIFIDECQRDAKSLSAAGTNRMFGLIGADGRTDRRRLADKFLRRYEQEAPYIEMPTADEPGTTAQTLVFAPGMLNRALPVFALQDVFPRLQERFGVDVVQIDGHPVRSCAGNVDDLLASLDPGAPQVRGLDATGRPLESPVEGELLLMGYSKGLADITETLVRRPDLGSRVRGVVGWGGASGGSYLANDMHARVKGMATVEHPTAAQAREALSKIAPWAPLPPMKRLTERLDDWDIVGAMADMTTDARERWWAENRDAVDALEVPFFTVAGSARVVEVPWYQAMAAAQLLLKDPINDMQLTEAQAQVPLPMAVHLATVRAHHWDLAFDGFPIWARMGSHGLSNRFAKLPALSALILLLHEIGLLTRG